MIAYYGADIDFVDNHKFYEDELTLHPDKVGARESITDDYAPDFEGGFYGYVVEVHIHGLLFNPFNQNHLSKLYNTLPKSLHHSLLGVTDKDILIACLKAHWYNDDTSTEANLENSDNVLYFEDNNLKDIIKTLEFDGIIMMEEEMPLYLVFNPDENLEILNISM